jgi:hypothetical protein
MRNGDSSFRKFPIGSIFISVTRKQSGRLVPQPADFPQRGTSAYSSAHSPPDCFLTSLPDFKKIHQGNKDAFSRMVAIELLDLLIYHSN